MSPRWGFIVLVFLFLLRCRPSGAWMSWIIKLSKLFTLKQMSCGVHLRMPFINTAPHWGYDVLDFFISKIIRLEADVMPRPPTDGRLLICRPSGALLF
jgi:hypothetical protein